VGLGRFITHTMFGRGASDYGAVPVPGSQQFELPAGKVFLTYQESEKSKSSITDTEGGIEVFFSAPPGLQVSVTPVSGGSPLLISQALTTNTATKKGQSRDAIGSVQIPAPGSYTVTTGPELPDAVEPQVLLGS
jgi:hypothetical protein